MYVGAKAMNAVEVYEAEKGGDGLRIREDLPRLVRDGWESFACRHVARGTGLFQAVVAVEPDSSDPGQHRLGSTFYRSCAVSHLLCQTKADDDGGDAGVIWGACRWPRQRPSDFRTFMSS